MDKFNPHLINKNDDFLNEKKEIFSDAKFIKHLLSLGFTKPLIEKYICKVYVYYLDFKYCLNCEGEQKCSKQERFIFNQISIKNGNVVSNIAPCKKKRESMLIQKRFLYNDFSNNDLIVTINDVSFTNVKKQALIDYKHFIKKEEFSWIYLKGKGKSGKSFFAYMIGCLHAYNSKKTVAFINSKKRFEDLNYLYHSSIDEYYEQLNKLSKVNLLIIDDFGKEAKSDSIRDEVILPILKYRSDHKLMTIFTSKYDIDDIFILYNRNKLSYEGAKAIKDLLNNNCVRQHNFGDLSIYDN